MPSKKQRPPSNVINLPLTPAASVPSEEESLLARLKDLQPGSKLTIGTLGDGTQTSTGQKDATLVDLAVQAMEQHDEVSEGLKAKRRRLLQILALEKSDDPPAD